MKSQSFLILLFAIFLISCEKEDEPIWEPEAKDYQIQYRPACQVCRVEFRDAQNRIVVVDSFPMKGKLPPVMHVKSGFEAYLYVSKGGGQGKGVRAEIIQVGEKEKTLSLSTSKNPHANLQARWTAP